MVKNPYTKKDVDELIRTLRGYNGTPGVMERLATVETILQRLDKWVTIQMEKPPQNDHLVSWTWVRDKIVQPGFILLIGWLFFSFIPGQLAK